MIEIVAAHDAGELRPLDATAEMKWSDAALLRLGETGDASLRDNLRLRAEKKARSLLAAIVTPEHLAVFLDASVVPQATPHEQAAVTDPPALHWEAAALARLARVPEGFMRDASRTRIEDHVRQQGSDAVTLDLAEAGLASARAAMAQATAADGEGKAEPAGKPVKCPFSTAASLLAETDAPAPHWTEAAAARLQAVPAGFCRRLTERAANTLAAQSNRREIDADFVQGIMEIFKSGSRGVETRMPWAARPRARIERAPEAVRGMLIKEIEGWAQRQGLAKVDERAVRAIKREWQARGVFHLDPDDPRSDV